MASALGSGIVAIAAFLVICVFALLLVRYFLPIRSTPSYLSIPIVVSIVLPISIILLVPVDLASSSRPEDEAGSGIWLSEGVLLVAWRIAYWLTFVLTWLVLPILGEYVDSGYRKPLDRFLYSLKSNGRYWLVVIACSILGAVYILFQNGFHGESFKALAMALAYFVGLLQAIYMMGHGLVVIPRRLIRNANIAGRLKRTQAQAAKVHEKMDDAVQESIELDQQLQQLRRKSDLSAEHKDWVEDMREVTSILDDRRQTATAGLPAQSAPPPSFITDRYLAEFSRRLNRARHKRDRFVEAWVRIVRDAGELQAILDSKASGALQFQQTPNPSTYSRLLPTLLTPSLRCTVHTKLFPAMRLLSAGVLSLASVCIVWSEMVKYMAPRLSIISLTVIHHVDGDNAQVGFGGQFIASLWILYMCACVLASFGDVKVWGNRALVRRNTYGESACWYAAQVAKLTVPLTYNFLTFIPWSIRQKTTFYMFLGKLIDLTPLGDWFDNLFPILVLIPVGAALFNLYGRVQRVLGFGLMEDEDEDESSGSLETSGWRDGKALIEAELQGRTDLDSSSLLGGQDGLDTGRRIGGRSSRTREAPSLYIPSEDNEDTEPAPSTQPSRLVAATQSAAEADDENIFSGFAHRFKNTIDAVERPEWLNDLGKRPKWMGRPGSAGGDPSGRADSGRGLGRWFGGRPSDGQVRLS